MFNSALASRLCAFVTVKGFILTENASIAGGRRSSSCMEGNLPSIRFPSHIEVPALKFWVCCKQFKSVGGKQTLAPCHNLSRFLTQQAECQRCKVREDGQSGIWREVQVPAVCMTYTFRIPSDKVCEYSWQNYSKWAIDFLRRLRLAGLWLLHLASSHTRHMKNSGRAHALSVLRTE